MLDDASLEQKVDRAGQNPFSRAARLERLDRPQLGADAARQILQGIAGQGGLSVPDFTRVILFREFDENKGLPR
jgi:hypothetical protein